MYAKLVALLLPALAAANPLPQSAFPAEQIRIVESSYSGQGCPQNSVSTSTSLDGTVITYGFDLFQTYIGPGTPRAENSKSCSLHLNLAYPGGFQYAVLEATYHGFARLDPGITGTFITTYFFSQDASKTSTTRLSIEGNAQLALGDVYTKTDKVETTSVIWSPCGNNGILNINNRLSLTSKNSKAAGEFTNDDATVALTQQLHVAWRPCTPGDKGNGGNAGDDIRLGQPSGDVIWN